MKKAKEPTEAAVTLHAWCRAVLAHIVERAGASGPSYQSFEDNLDKALAMGMERELKVAAGDLREWAMGLQRSVVEAIDKDLRARFGTGLIDAAKAADKEAKRILRRGSIADDDEYRFLVAWLDQVGDSAEQRRTAEAVGALMGVYDRKYWKGP